MIHLNASNLASILRNYANTLLFKHSNLFQAVFCKDKYFNFCKPKGLNSDFISLKKAFRSTNMICQKFKFNRRETCTNALWTNECHFAKILLNRVKNCCIRVKFVAILSPLQKCNPFFRIYNHKEYKCTLKFGPN